MVSHIHVEGLTKHSQVANLEVCKCAADASNLLELVLSIFSKYV